MSASTLTLKLWSNFNRQHLAQLINIGDTWVIDPDGPILEPADQVDTTSAPGVLKIYHKVHPNSLVIHWMFPNLYVGHILWISQAPLQITKAQVDTVRCIERQLAKDWEYAARWEFIMCTPPPVNIPLGSRALHSVHQSPYSPSRSRSKYRPRRSLTRNHRALRQVT